MSDPRKVENHPSNFINFPPSRFLVQREDPLHSVRVDVKVEKYFTPVAVNLSHFFSLDEDELILAEKDNAPHPPYEYILKAYFTKHKVNPSKFPKGNLSTTILREHLEKLELDHLRCRILRHRIMKKRDREFSTISGVSQSSANSSRLGTPRIGRKKKRMRKKRNIQKVDSFEMFSSPDVANSRHSSDSKQEHEQVHSNVSIILPDERDQMQAIAANSDCLGKVSKYFKDYFMHGYVSNITLRDVFQKFKGYAFFTDTFRHENINRFVKFSENPSIKDEYLKFYRQINSKKEKSFAQKKKLLETIEQRFEKYERRLEVQTKEAVEKSTEYLKECRERDLKLIKELYDSHIFTIQSEINRIKEQKFGELRKHQRKEKEKLSALYDDLFVYERSELETSIRELEHSIQEIVPSDSLLKMLLIAEVLRCESLKHLCLDIITFNQRSFISSKELGHEIFTPSTYKVMVSKFDTETIFKLKNNDIPYSFPSNYVVQEWMMREKSRIDDYKRLTTNELKDLERVEKSYFADLLKEEISRRDKHIPIVNFDMKSKSRGILVNQKELRVEVPVRMKKKEKKHSFSYQSLRVNTPKRWNDRTFGVSYFEVVIESMGGRNSLGMVSPGNKLSESTNGGVDFPSALRQTNTDQMFDTSSWFDPSSIPVMVIGWDVKRSKTYPEEMGKIIIGKNPNKDGEFGYSLQNDGIFYYNGSSKVLFGSEYREGDILGFSIQQFHDPQKRDILRFYKNGEILGISKNLDYISIRSSNYELYPAISIYPQSSLLTLPHETFSLRGGQSVQVAGIRVRFNFAGVFKYPLGFGTPYSEKDARFATDQNGKPSGEMTAGEEVERKKPLFGTPKRRKKRFAFLSKKRNKN